MISNETSRREFLEALFGLSVTAAAGSLFSPHFALAAKDEGKSHVLLSCYQVEGWKTTYDPKTKKSTHTGGNFGFSAYHLDTGKVQTWPIPFEGHSAVSHPLRPHEVVVFPNDGPSVVKVNLQTEKTTSWQPTEGFAFQGHGVFTKDAKTLFATESETYALPGILSVRDADTGKIIGRFDSYGVGPHEIHALEDGKTLAIANSGERVAEPSICFVDMSSGKLLEKFVPDKKDGVNFLHMALGKDGYFVAAPKFFKNAPSASGIPVAGTEPQLFYGKRGEKGLKSIMVKNPQYNPNLFQLFSISIKDNFVLATSKYSEQVFVFDIKKNECVKEYKLKSPRGAALSEDGSQWIVSSLQWPATPPLVISTSTLEEVKSPIPNLPTVSTSGHLMWLKV